MAFEYLLHILIISCIYGMLAVSLNIVVGLTGILNLGHAAFYGIGAYTSALLMVYFGVPWVIAMLAGALLAAFFGLLVSIPSLKLRGDYLAIATLGFGEIARAVLLNWSDVTRGPLGISAIPQPVIFGVSFDSPESYAILALTMLAIVVFITWRISKSPFGRVLKAIRENELAALAMAKNTSRFKMTAVVISAFFAGIAGSLYAHYVTFIDPYTFGLAESTLIVAIVVLGGMGSIRGALTGVLFVAIVDEGLRFVGFAPDVIGPARQMIYAILLIVLMLYRPQGIFGEYSFKTPNKTS